MTLSDILTQVSEADVPVTYVSETSLQDCQLGEKLNLPVEIVISNITILIPINLTAWTEALPGNLQPVHRSAEPPPR